VVQRCRSRRRHDDYIFYHSQKRVVSESIPQKRVVWESIADIFKMCVVVEIGFLFKSGGAFDSGSGVPNHRTISAPLGFVS